jgi:ribulose-phosphate 3-epimerase
MKMKKEIKVIPAIIPESFDDLRHTLQHVKSYVNRVQIDVTDGMYTPNISWPYEFKRDEDFERIINQDEGMPFWQDVNFDIDLMITNPEEEYQKWIDAGASALIFHLESLPADGVEFIKKVKKENMIDVAVAIKTTTPNEKLEPYLDLVDFVQFMGIEKIGYQGQTFDEKVLEKIKWLREKMPDIDIAVDGSVNFDTAERLIKAGANLLASGSAILKAEDVGEAIEELRGDLV